MKLQASELRIGNRVEYLLDEGRLNREEYYWHLNIIDAEDILWLSKNDDTNYRPMLLTEEWLLKFGFEKTSLHYFKKDGIIIQEDNYFECFLGNILVDIKYIHQLQNLYFALTGLELTIMDTLNN